MKDAEDAVGGEGQGEHTRGAEVRLRLLLEFSRLSYILQLNSVFAFVLMT